MEQAYDKMLSWELGYTSGLPFGFDLFVPEHGETDEAAEKRLNDIYASHDAFGLPLEEGVLNQVDG